MISPSDLAAIQQRADAATAGPWHDDGYRIYAPTDGTDPRSGRVIVEYKHADGFNAADAVFITHARTDVPKLLAHVASLEAEVERLREAMEIAVDVLEDGAARCIASDHLRAALAPKD